MPWVLTVEYLRDVRGACLPQVDLFVAEFPSGMEWTAQNLRRCADIGMDLDWYAIRTFTREQAIQFVEGRTLAMLEMHGHLNQHRHLVENVIAAEGPIFDPPGFEARLAGPRNAFLAATNAARRNYRREAARVMFETAPDHQGKLTPTSDEEVEVILTSAKTPGFSGTVPENPSAIGRVLRAVGLGR